MQTYDWIIHDKLLSLCVHLIDEHQHDFVLNKSCFTQLVTLYLYMHRI